MREIFLFLMMLPFCSQLSQMMMSPTAPQPAGVSPTIIGSDTFEGAIFPAGYVTDLDLWMGYAFSDYWTPSETDIYAFEGGIRDFLIQTADPRFYQQPPVWDRLPEYKRQYFGVMIDGRRLLFANFFCINDPNWTTDLVVVLDGGECFWHVMYDPATGEYLNLQVNGEA